MYGGRPGQKGAGGVREAGEERAAGEEREMGKITQQWSIFCNKKRDKVKKRGGGIRVCKVREAGVTPPPPNPSTPSAPPLPHYCIMLMAL